MSLRIDTTNQTSSFGGNSTSNTTSSTTNDTDTGNNDTVSSGGDAHTLLNLEKLWVCVHVCECEHFLGGQVEAGGGQL